MKSYKETSASVVDFRKKKDNQRITPEACSKVDGRAKAKAKDPQNEYNITNKDVRGSV